MSSAKWRPFCLGLNVLRVNKKSLSNPTPALLDYLHMLSIEFEFQKSDFLRKKLQ